MTQVEGGAVAARGKSGQIRFDGRTVTITRDGLRGRTIHGRGEKSIPLSQIAGVQFVPWTWTKGWGYLSLTVPGSIESQRKHRRGVDDALHDENAVVFSKRQQPEFKALRDALSAALA